LVPFLLVLGATIWLTPMLAGTYGGVAALWWGVLLRAAVFLYVFTFLDAYFTAREMTAGTDPFIAESPRVAAILNLLTRGFGYFYLGQRTAGFAVFIGLGFVQQVILKRGGQEERSVGGLFMEAILAGLAVHAYRIARKREKEILATVEPAPQLAPIAALPAAVPVGLATLLGAAYVALCCIPLFMPDYSAINQTPAHIVRGDLVTVYANRQYGIGLSAPAAWSLEDQDTKHVVSARRDDNVCAVDMRLAAWPLILPLGSYAKALSAQLERPENAGTHLVQSTPAMLGNLVARDIVLTLHGQEGQITEHRVVARKGMTLYILTTDSLTESAPDCQSDFSFIQQNLVLPK
jgi:hypothetical protein